MAGMKPAKKTARLLTGRGLHVVLVTAPDRSTARRLARAALEAKLVACANLVPGLESHYWWQDKIETSKEVLLMFKTTARQLNALARLITDKHPYDTPEFVALPVQRVSPRYGQWWRASVA